MEVRVEIDSLEAQQSLTLMNKAVRRELAIAIDAIGDDIRGTAIEKISNTSGRTGRNRLFIGQGKSAYYADPIPQNSKYNWGGAIRASAKGEYPAANTGFLAKSIVKNQESDLVLSVVATADYAARLEYDLDRPFMKMATVANRENMTKRVNKAVDRIMKA